MRKLLVPLIAAAALAAPSAAMAGGNDDWDWQRPTPLPTTVTNESQANDYTKAYVNRNAQGITNVDLRGRGRSFRRVTVSDVAASCLQHPVIAARFGCVFRFNIEIRDNDRRGHNDRGDRDYRRAHSSSKGGGDDDWDRRDRGRDRTVSLGCLGALRIVAGPGVTPQAQLVFADCVRRDRRH
jgi:hypothetical protein